MLSKLIFQHFAGPEKNVRWRARRVKILEESALPFSYRKFDPSCRKNVKTNNYVAGKFVRF